MKTDTAKYRLCAGTGWRRGLSRRWSLPCLLAASVVLALGAMPLNASSQAQISIASVNAPEGATVMLPVTYTAPAEKPPATLLVRLGYFSTKLEALEVVAAPTLAQHDKSLDYRLGAGSIAIAVFGGITPVPDGTLLYLVMRLKPDAQVGNVLFVSNMETHGADSDAERATVQVTSGNILVTEDPGKHSADTTQDWSITLPELLRVIQLYNASAYHCDPQGEDGYEAGPGDQTCAPHDTDYAPADWSFSFSELLRMVQLYNAPYRAYHVDPASEDGFAPGPFGFAP